MARPPHPASMRCWTRRSLHLAPPPQPSPASREREFSAPSLAKRGRVGEGVHLMQPTEPLRQFLQAARGAGIRVSAAEGIDAARAVQLVGFGDPTVLKDTLSLVLA